MKHPSENLCKFLHAIMQNNPRIQVERNGLKIGLISKFK